jgi:short-subunit dehydrogenase
MTNRLKGKTILITGASSGIGRMTALLLAGAGVRLVLVARRTDRLQTLAHEITAKGSAVAIVEGDVTSAMTFERAIHLGLERFARLDVLINNAGAGFFGTIDQTTESDLDRMLAVNFKGAFHGIKAVLPVMRGQGTGHIINIASMAGRRGSPYVGAYCAAKFALVGFTESLRTELLGTGIRVSLVCPGATRTEFFRAAVRRTHEHDGLVGPVDTPEQVATRIVRLITHPRADVMAQPFRRKIFLTLNLLAPGLIDRLVAYLVASRQSHAHLDNNDVQI